MINKNVNERRTDIDLIKAVAIFLVLWGHAIQYWHGVGYDYWSDRIFKFIYGFHMPLFAYVSGYLFWSSLQRNAGDVIIRKRVTKLLIPTCVWTFIIVAVNTLGTIMIGKSTGLSAIIHEIITSLMYDFWFYNLNFAPGFSCF